MMVSSLAFAASLVRTAYVCPSTPGGILSITKSAPLTVAGTIYCRHLSVGLERWWHGRRDRRGRTYRLKPGEEGNEYLGAVGLGIQLGRLCKADRAHSTLKVLSARGLALAPNHDVKVREQRRSLTRSIRWSRAGTP